MIDTSCALLRQLPIESYWGHIMTSSCHYVTTNNVWCKRIGMWDERQSVCLDWVVTSAIAQHDLLRSLLGIDLRSIFEVAFGGYIINVSIHLVETKPIHSQCSCAYSCSIFWWHKVTRKNYIIYCPTTTFFAFDDLFSLNYRMIINEWIK